MLYLYYRIYKFYQNIIEESDSDVYTISFISLTQYLYLEFFISIYGIYINEIIPFSLEKILIAITIIFAINYLYFNIVKIKDSNIEKWENESKAIKYIKGCLMIFYIIIAPIFLYLSIIYGDYLKSFLHS